MKEDDLERALRLAREFTTTNEPSIAFINVSPVEAAREIGSMLIKVYQQNVALREWIRSNQK